MTGKDLFVGLAAMVLVVAAMAGTLYFVDLVDFSDAEAASKALTAAIGLVGVLFTGAISMLGLVFKNGQDRRLALEAERNRQLAREAESRLGSEAVLKAVALVHGDATATPATRSGALASLVELGRTEFALRLLDQLWPPGQVDASCAVFVIDRALRHPERPVQNLAAVILEKNVRRLPDRTGNFHWPASLDVAWDPKLDHATRRYLLKALLKVLPTHQRSDWEEDVVSGMTVWFWRIFESEPDEHLRGAAGMAFSEIVSGFAEGKAPRIADRENIVSTEELRRRPELAAIESSAVSKELKTLAEDLGTWARSG